MNGRSRKGLGMNKFCNCRTKIIADTQSQKGEGMKGMDGIPKRLYNIEEAGHYLGRSKWMIREMVRQGKLPVVKYDRRVFIDIHEMDEMIEATKERRHGKPRTFGKSN